MTSTHCSRRHFLSAISAMPAIWAAGPSPRPTSALRGRVAVGACHDYGPRVLSVMKTMFDRIGGLERLVMGKTVAVKLNLTGSANDRLGSTPPGMTHWVHPDVIGTTIYLMARAGAHRMRLLESPWSTAEPLEEFMLAANWEPRDFLSAAPRVEFENTNYLGRGKKYSRFMVPGGGLMYKGYDLNHSYENCDVFVSLAKLKEHRTTGVTLAMKNCFGITPCTIYGDGSPEDEPGRFPTGGRGPFHAGSRLPAKSAPPPVDVHAPKEEGFRVPRVVADLVAARPVHLSISDGIHTLTGGEGPWAGRCKRINPELLIVGANCVNTDSVAMALMGFDPMAQRGAAPFENCDNTLFLAEQLGVGTRDLRQIKVVGTPIAKGRLPFRAA